MARRHDHDNNDGGDAKGGRRRSSRTRRGAIGTPSQRHPAGGRLRDLGISCMLNTEVGAVLAVIRRASDAAGSSHFLPSPADDANSATAADSHLLLSLKSLRSLIFQPSSGEWGSVDPSVYLGPFLDVVQNDDVPASATGVALSAVLKILNLEIFDDRTPGAREAIHSVVRAVTNCRLERTDPASEDAVLMRILQVLTAVLRNPASLLLSDHAVSTVVNTCFQVVQQSASRGDLLQRNARYTMHELVQIIFSRLPEIEAADGTNDGYSDSDPDEDGRVLSSGGGMMSSGHGARCMVDVFQFLCSLLNVVEVVDSAEGFGSICSDEDIQLFALILINSALELGGESIGKHPKLLRMIQDDLFHHLIHYGTRTSPLVLSMICSTVLNLYHFLRSSMRLQLEAFFTFVLLRAAGGDFGTHLQEVAVEGIVCFCRQPTFAIEMYVNYDCDPVCRDIFEDIVRLLCKSAFPVNNSLSPMQVQAFEGLNAVVGAIAKGMDLDGSPDGETYQMEISEFRPFWMERSEGIDDLEAWVEFVRMRKFKKKKIMIAANHFNRDEKKGLDFLKISHLVPDPPDAKSLAYFFRYTPGLDKNKIGDFLGDPGEINLQVLAEFTKIFDFSGMILDTALRAYLETFRLPGESQKIQRILEAFSESFHDQQPSGIFESKDAIFILCYSLIMLNTDQHNPQVKKKMTEEEFIRNNRAINGGKDLPREYLSELFNSISNNAITLFGNSGSTIEMTFNRWVNLLKRSRTVEPFILCDFEHRLSRDAFAAVAGPSVAALSAIFEHTDDEEILQESIEGLLSVARISQYALEDVIDELVACFCKFTTLMNPYATAEETLFTFSNDMRSRMATLAVFTIVNKFGVSVRGGWRNVVDCVLKLRRLKLLPQSLTEPDKSPDSGSNFSSHAKSESGVFFPLSSHPRFSNTKQSSSGLMGRFSQFLSLDSGADSMANVCSEFENNLKIIQQCQIGSIFTESSKLPDESLQNLGRALIFAAAGKGQKFSTPVEEEETVGFCSELLVTITLANIHRFSTFWSQFHDYFSMVAQFPLFSPCPFSEKAILSLFTICMKIFSTPSTHDKLSEELIFKSINMMWKLDKEILDTCYESLAESTITLLTEHRGTIQTFLGWKTLLQLLSITGRYPETYHRSVEALISLMADGTYITMFNYSYCIEAAFGFAALKISSLENSFRIIDLMADSVYWLIQWHKSGYLDAGGSNLSNGSNASSSSTEDVPKSSGNNVVVSLFMKLVEALRKTSLVRREEIRNHTVSALHRCFAAMKDLDLSAANCIGWFNLIIFAMVDDLHEKMLEYSCREGSEKEVRSMEATLKGAMELLVEVYLQFLMTLSQSSGFRSFWLGLLRRMDTCMKADLGNYGEASVLHELVPQLLKKMIVEMKEKEILVQRDGDELWDITNIQIQWIAPALKDELFPEEF